MRRRLIRLAAVSALALRAAPAAAQAPVTVLAA